MKKSILMFIAAAALVLSGCASSPMKPVTQATPEQVDSNNARVIFMRPSLLGAAISASVFDVQGDDLKFVGIVNAKTKIAYDTTPGEHLFMVVGESADFMKADLLPGKNYFALVAPRMGMWKARFSLRPVRNDGSTNYNTSTKEFNDWVKNTNWVENTPESLNWFEKNKPNIVEKKDKYWKDWQAKSTDSQDEATMRSTDGQEATAK